MFGVTYLRVLSLDYGRVSLRKNTRDDVLVARMRKISNIQIPDDIGG